MALKEQTKVTKVVEKVEDPRVSNVLKELDLLQKKIQELSKHTHQGLINYIKELKEDIPQELIAGLGIHIEGNQIINTDAGSKAVDAYSKVLKAKLEEMFNKFREGFNAINTTIQMVSREVEKLQLIEHSHPNMEELDAVSDGFHSEDKDNPHLVDCGQIGAAPVNHEHPVVSDPRVDDLEAKLKEKADKKHKHKSELPDKIKECVQVLSKVAVRVDALEDKINRIPSKLFDLDGDFKIRKIKRRK